MACIIKCMYEVLCISHNCQAYIHSSNENLISFRTVLVVMVMMTQYLDWHGIKLSGISWPVLVLTVLLECGTWLGQSVCSQFLILIRLVFTLYYWYIHCMQVIHVLAEEVSTETKIFDDLPWRWFLRHAYSVNVRERGVLPP